MAKYYGIDLGTTNSCVTVYDFDSDKTTVLKPPGQGNLNVVPSVVFYKSATEILVGYTAKKRRFNTNTPTEQLFHHFKPELGTDTSWSVFDLTVTPLSLSAEVLKKVKEIAGLLGHQITSAVITCPATFGAKERNAIIEAAKLADIAVDPAYGLVDEPSAAAYDYAIEKDINLIILDLGGGTLDISLMTCEKDEQSDFFKYTPINNGGRKNLGGRDWDAVLVGLINEAILALPSELRKDLDGDGLLQDDKLQKMIQCEVDQVKENLTNEAETSFEYFKDDYEIEVVISRDTFEQATTHLCEQFLNYLEETLAQHPQFKADQLILVGGATLMPQIRQGIETKCPEYKELLVFHDEPFYSVARGAAKYKHLVEQGAIINKLYCSYAIGPASSSLSKTVKLKTRLTNFFVKGAILQAEPLLESRRITVQTTIDDQGLLSLGIYQNETDTPTLEFSEGVKVGTVHVELPQKVPQGSVFHLIFFMDTNKLLSVEAEEDDSNPVRIYQKLNAKLKL